MPISAVFSPEDGGMKGLMRVIMVIDPDLPTLRAEISVDGHSDVDLTPRDTVFASFWPADAKAYARQRPAITGR
jgi:hypothetical protein